MQKIPRIAILKPSDDDLSWISPVFERHEYSLRTVSSADEILALINEESAAFDCIVVPPRSAVGNSLNFLLQVKTRDTLSSVPVLGLLGQKDRALMHSLYGAGADVILLSPLDADMVYEQILALGRQRRAVDELLQRHFEDTGMRQSSINAFNAIREGIVICDHEYALTFINSAGALLLGIKPSHTLEQVQASVRQFIPLMQKHAELHSGRSSDPQERTDISLYSAITNRLDGRAFKAEARVTTLRGSQGQTVGYAIALTDLSGILQLSQLLVQAQRTRSLTLLTGAACMQLLGPGPLHAPLQLIEQALSQQAASASLSDTMTYLLEMLDALILPGVDVKVKARGDWLVALRPSDLFQLMGQLTLLAVENAILGGEIILDVLDPQARSVNFVVTSRSESRVRFVQDDLVSQIIEGSLLHLKQGQQNKVSQAFASAQRIATRYRATVIVERSSELEMRMSVDLPLAALA
ncbi:MAG: PAS domain-containing protein [Oligoflexia bacterium]|nr:PAS domain-containing protein [Oligoflexia bacterium]